MDNQATLLIAEGLFKKAHPERNFEQEPLFNFERERLAGDVASVLGHTLIAIHQTVANKTDFDGRQFGSHRVGTLFAVIDPRGVVYEGSDSTKGVGGGRWDADLTSYEFTQIFPRGEGLVLMGNRTESRQSYDERRCFQGGGWVVIPIGKHPIEVELKKVGTVEP